MTQHSNCILCQSGNLKGLETYKKAFLCQCQSCQFVFSQQIPSNDELDNYYRNYGLNQYLSPLTIKRYNELLDQFESFRKTNKILDVGCGLGYFLEEAKKRGWEVYGTELSDKATEVCVKKGINIIKGALNLSDFEPNMFDVITSFEVIEHINNPKSELAYFNRVLRPQGLVYITTPNFNSLLRYQLKAQYNVITYPEHLSYYTPKTLKHLFETNGFTKQNIESTGISLTRFKTSKGTSTQKFISAKSDDEKIRNQVDSKWYLKMTKDLVNALLTALGKGDSLKGWFIKN